MTTKTKTPKETKAPAKEAPAKEAPAKDTASRDKFGCREGSQAATINAAITTKPKTVDAIATETGLNAGRVRAHLKFLLEKKLIAETKTDDGLAYAVAKAAKGK